MDFIHVIVPMIDIGEDCGADVAFEAALFVTSKMALHVGLQSKLFATNVTRHWGGARVNHLKREKEAVK